MKKTTAECVREFSEIWREAFLAIAYALKLDYVVKFLAKMIDAFTAAWDEFVEFVKRKLGLEVQ